MPSTARPPAPPDATIAAEETACAPDSPFAEVLRLAAAWAGRECPVFLHGESGTGKEVLARFVHRKSRRRSGPFVAVNCAAVAPGLVESELFGHKRGAFTGAFSDRPGRIRQAQGGTLFLDEVGDMPLELQARLLRVLQEKRVCPVGGDEEIAVDFRLVCATHRDLSRAVAAGTFRQDLSYRMRVLELRLPPLRERVMDIPGLLRRFLGELMDAEAAARAVAEMPAGILRHPFPGNVRELRNMAERFAALHEAGGDWSHVLADARANYSPASPALHGAGRNSRLRDDEILAALEACGHHRARAADKLGVTRRALQYRLATLRSAGGEPV